MTIPRTTATIIHILLLVLAFDGGLIFGVVGGLGLGGSGNVITSDRGLEAKVSTSWNEVDIYTYISCCKVSVTFIQYIEVVWENNIG